MLDATFVEVSLLSDTEGPVELYPEALHGRVRSLYAMLRLDARQFLLSTRLIARSHSILKRAAKKDGTGTLPDDVRSNLNKSLKSLLSITASMRLPVSNDSVLRLQKALELNQPVTRLVSLIDQVESTMESELKSTSLFHIPYHLSSFYDADISSSWRGVPEKFPSALIDIEEAGKCLALSRSTACVFHLMRVIECGLRVMGKSLNDPNLDPKKNPTWDRILQKCDKELQAPYAQRTSEWQTHSQFFAEATANLRAVKDAWRNPTLHVEQFYDEERALDVWNAVRAFMRHLATVISE